MRIGAISGGQEVDHHHAFGSLISDIRAAAARAQIAEAFDDTHDMPVPDTVKALADGITAIANALEMIALSRA
jgi:3-deoxy-D-manno-octulosonic acid (KDO) 8-phosphate synthase